MNRSTKDNFQYRQPMEMKKQIIGDHMIPVAGKRVAVHSKDPYYIRKPNPFAKIKKPEKELDGFLILDITGCALSHEVIFLKAVSKQFPLIPLILTHIKIKISFPSMKENSAISST